MSNRVEDEAESAAEVITRTQVDLEDDRVRAVESRRTARHAYARPGPGSVTRVVREGAPSRTTPPCLRAAIVAVESRSTQDPAHGERVPALARKAAAELGDRLRARTTARVEAVTHVLALGRAASRIRDLRWWHWRIALADVRAPFVSFWSPTHEVPEAVTAALTRSRRYAAITDPADLVTPRFLVLSPSAVHALLTPVVLALGEPTGRERAIPLASHLCLTNGPGVGDLAPPAWLPAPSYDDTGRPIAETVRIHGGRNPVGALPALRARFRGKPLDGGLDRPLTNLPHQVRLISATKDSPSVETLLSASEPTLLIESFAADPASVRGVRIPGRILDGALWRAGEPVRHVRGLAATLDVRRMLGARSTTLSREVWAVTRRWTGALPYAAFDTAEGR
ncbi:MAG: hypothetical protein ACRCYQ_06285 [Nocardioides sp.]